MPKKYPSLREMATGQFNFEDYPEEVARGKAAAQSIRGGLSNIGRVLESIPPGAQFGPLGVPLAMGQMAGKTPGALRAGFQKAMEGSQAIGKVTPEALNKIYAVVTRMAQRYSRGNPSSYEDMVNTGMEGVLKMAGKASDDPAAFERAATSRASHEMKRLLAQSQGPVRVPDKIVHEIGKIRNYEESYRVRHGEAPRDIQIAVKFNMPVEKVRQLRAERSTEAGVPLADMPNLAITPMAEGASETQLATLRDAMDKLPDAQKRYAQLRGQGLGMIEAATAMGVTKSRATVLERTVMGKLRAMRPSATPTDPYVKNALPPEDLGLGGQASLEKIRGGSENPLFVSPGATANYKQMLTNEEEMARAEDLLRKHGKVPPQGGTGIDPMEGERFDIPPRASVFTGPRLPEFRELARQQSTAGGGSLQAQRRIEAMGTPLYASPERLTPDNPMWDVVMSPYVEGMEGGINMPGRKIPRPTESNQEMWLQLYRLLGPSN